jgi:hypothetical protein
LIKDEDLPSREITIFEIKELDKKTISVIDLQTEIHRKISLVKGDFRQKS